MLSIFYFPFALGAPQPRAIKIQFPVWPYGAGPSWRESAPARFDLINPSTTSRAPLSLFHPFLVTEARAENSNTTKEKQRNNLISLFQREWRGDQERRWSWQTTRLKIWLIPISPIVPLQISVTFPSPDPSCFSLSSVMFSFYLLDILFIQLPFSPLQFTYIYLPPYTAFSFYLMV